ncbi:hypothetical protein, variant 2 [Verruconis gallopava]|nr:hypothetical protein, variant 2 [Verruconis gallopava]KIW05475.1 hypothetical protein, variant 2 [Verruconis gallopava]
MGTPHRGLPPPSAMTLGPEPVRSIPPPLSTSFAGMPEPPRQWQGAEESMNRWLLTKAEEEKRKQEEERTRQESLRLEQRRIEQGILLEAIRSGIPPHLVPIIFAGIGSHSVANLSVEWLQQYNNSLHAAQQQQQISSQSQATGSPDNRRERLLAGPQPYPPSAPIPGAASSQQPPAGPSSAPYGYGSNPLSPSVRSQPPPSGPSSSSTRGPLQQVLPRVAPEEQRSSSAHQVLSGAVQPVQMQMGQPEQSASSPGGGIFFHHWQPPSSQSAGGNQPPTPSENTNSPKRRKAQVLQPTSMPPTSEPRYSASSFVHVTSPVGSTSSGRKRRLSDTSTTNRPGQVTSRKNRSRGNTESSAAMPEEDRLVYLATTSTRPRSDHEDHTTTTMYPDPTRPKESS